MEKIGDPYHVLCTVCKKRTEHVITEIKPWRLIEVGTFQCRVCGKISYWAVGSLFPSNKSEKGGKK